MKKWAKNPWVLGIGTTVIGGVLLSLLLDWIQGIDWLSTFKNVMRFIFNGVVSFLNFEIKVWWLLIAIAIIVVGLFVVAKISGSQSNNIPPPHFYKDPLFVEDDVFRIIVPLDDAYSSDYGIETGSSKVIESNNADKMPINADKMPINAGKTLVNSLSAQQNSIIQFAKETGSIKSRQVEELLGVKQRRARRILGELVNMGILERQGAYKSTVYVLKN